MDPPSPALDSTAYPNILDNIIFLSDYETLLHLRSISRYLKRKSDRSKKRKNAIKVSNVDGLIPAFAEWGCTSRREAYKISKLDRDSASLPAVTSYLQALRADLSYTSTIDVVAMGGHFPPYTEALITARLQSPSPLTVRVLQPRLAPTEALPGWISLPIPWSKLHIRPCDTVVQFARLSELIKAEPRFLDERPPAACTHARVVRNIAFHPDDTKGSWPMARWHASTPRGAESVYIFHRAPEAVQYDGRPEFSRDSRHLLRQVVVRLVMDLIATRSPTLVVQVNVLAGVPTAPGERGFATQEDFTANCRGVVPEARECLSRLGEEPHPSVTDQEVEAAIEGIRFMSLEAYGAAVGPRRAALETIADGVWF